jgi:hypothetical protein
VGICVIAFAVLGFESLFDSTIISNKGKGFQRFVSILEILAKNLRDSKKTQLPKTRKLLF